MQALSNIGHNNPPSESEILEQRLEDNYQKLHDEYGRLSKKDIPEVVNNEEEAQPVTDYIKAVKSLKKSVTEAHKKEKAPFLEAGRIADTWKKNYEIKIENLAAKAEKPLQVFLVKKQEEERQRQLDIARKAREDAERLAEQAREHEAEGINDTAEDLMDAAMQSEGKAQAIQSSALDVKGRVRSSMGASASQKITWTGEIESVAAIDLNALKEYFTEDHIQTAINKAVRDGKRQIVGVKIHKKTSLNIR